MNATRAGEQIQLVDRVCNDLGDQAEISVFIEPGTALDLAEALTHLAELALLEHIGKCGNWIARPVRHCSRCESFEIRHPDRKRTELQP